MNSHIWKQLGAKQEREAILQFLRDRKEAANIPLHGLGDTAVMSVCATQKVLELTIASIENGDHID